MDDPADLPYVEKLLDADSHTVVTVFFEGVGRFAGVVKTPNENETAYVVDFDEVGTQYFCGRPKQDVGSIQPGEEVHLAGKVLMEYSVFVLQTCELERATPHQRAIADELRR